MFFDDGRLLAEWSGMQLGLVYFWDKVRSSFWFVPLIMMLLSAWLAFGMAWLDNRVEIRDEGPLGWLIVNAETARSTLSLLAGAMITLSGVVFSMTMVTLSLTANQFGSRLLRTAMMDITTQVALGAFLATALYSLVVMRFVPVNADSAFVPEMAVFLAAILAFGSLAFMILFVHHIGVVIQAQNVVAEVAKELDHAILRLFPEELGTSKGEESPESDDQPELGSRRDGTEVTLPAASEGYLQAIDVERLMSFARDSDLVLELLYRPGDFVIKGTPLVRLVNRSTQPGEDEAQSLNSELNAMILTGRRRTPRQDVGCAVNELVEIAVRALSPGVNDPFTAVACIDHMTGVLTRLLKRDIPSPRRYDDDGRLRVIARPTETASVIETAYRQIAHYGVGDVCVVLRIMEGLGQLTGHAVRDADRRAICHRAEALYREAEAIHRDPHDRERLKSLYDRICDLEPGR